MEISKTNPISIRQDWFFIFTGLALVSGFILSIISWLRICSEMCATTHDYRFYGMPFEYVGMLFFPAIILCHLLSKSYPSLRIIVGILLAMSVGVELMLILVQKYMIKHWCPICLTISLSIGIAALCFLLNPIEKLTTSQKGKFMRKSLTTTLVILFGFFFTFLGVGKITPLAAEENSLKKSLAFGNPNSNIELYLFTDWACPACRKLEPSLDKVMHPFLNTAKFTFVDFAIHDATLNYMPYNLSFIVHNKDKYLPIRDALTQLSIETSSPTEEEVEKAVKPLGVTYKALSYSDVSLGQKYYQHLADQFEIDATPTLVVVNRSVKKGKKLYGNGEITAENIQKAIDSLK